MDWCLKNTAISTIIPGCKNIEQIESNVKVIELI
jgi:aryl-alcohol dehydrogenase-like predicted oxidoreductase